MNKIRVFLRLGYRDKYLLLKIAFLMCAIRIGLSILPFRVLLSILRDWRERNPDWLVADPSSAKRVMWGIRTISRHLPGITCLTQALAALALMGKVGHAVSVKIGIAKEDSGGLTAHAWVELNGKVLLGNLFDISRYTILSPVGGQRIHERNIRNI